MKKLVDWTLMLMVASGLSLSLDNFRSYLADKEKAEEVLVAWVEENTVDADPVMDDIAYLMREDFSVLMGEDVFLPQPIVTDCGIRITVVQGDQIKDFRYGGDYTKLEMGVAEVIAGHLGIERMDELKPRRKKFKKFVTMFEEFQEAEDDKKGELLCNIEYGLEKEYGPPIEGVYTHGWVPVGLSGVTGIKVDWNDEYGLTWLVSLLGHEYGHTLIRQNAPREYKKQYNQAKKDGLNQEIITINETSANEIEHTYFYYFYLNHDIPLDELGYIVDNSLSRDIASAVTNCSYNKDFPSSFYLDNPAEDVINQRYYGNWDVKDKIALLNVKLEFKDFVYVVGYLYSFDDLDVAVEIVDEDGDLEDIITALDK